MEKFNNKYRIQSHRMPKWDYSGNGIYFITLVTQNRVCNLGHIINGKMIFSEFGKIINNEWLKSFEIRNELFLDEYIIMPNHLHTIVVLNKTQLNDNNESVYINGTIGPNNSFESNGLNDSHGTHVNTHGSHVETHGSHVETHGRASLQSHEQSHEPTHDQSNNQSTANQSTQNSIVQSTNPPKIIRKPKSISSFIAGFKSAINSKIDDYIDEFGLNIPKYNRNNHFFQPNYHDHIIRNDAEYKRIKEYIINNPVKWVEDKFNPLNNNDKE